MIFIWILLFREKKQKKPRACSRGGVHQTISAEDPVWSVRCCSSQVSESAVFSYMSKIILKLLLHLIFKPPSYQQDFSSWNSSPSHCRKSLMQGCISGVEIAKHSSQKFIQSINLEGAGIEPPSLSEVECRPHSGDYWRLCTPLQALHQAETSLLAVVPIISFFMSSILMSLSGRLEVQC